VKGAESLPFPFCPAAYRIDEVSRLSFDLDRSEGIGVSVVAGLGKLGALVEVRDTLTHPSPALWT
jgi:hypothetical protein